MKRIVLIVGGTILFFFGLAFYLVNRELSDSDMRENNTLIRMEIIQSILSEFRATCNSLPLSLEVLKKGDEKCSAFKPRFIIEIDGWGNPFMYRITDSGYEISGGKNGIFIASETDRPRKKR